MTRVSIITVVYNNEFIGTAIQSVIAQDYPHIEYIVVDGGSTDRTMDIIKGYGSRIQQVISEPDLGIYDALNKGINLATGDYVGLLHADDFMADPEVVSRVVKVFEENPGTNAAYADVIFTDPWDLNKVLRYYSSKHFKPWMFKFGFQPAHPTFYAEKSLFIKYGLYSTRYKIAGDFELLMRFLYIHKVKALYVRDVWVKMRIGGVSTAGLKSLFKLNKEILMACRSNAVYTNPAMVYSKYMVKWWGFIFRKT
jgi:glycosyltransferase involved in cell wall biosynthesis